MLGVHFFLVVFVFSRTLADKESLNHGHGQHKRHAPIHDREHYKDGEHDPDYDHEAVLGHSEDVDEFHHLAAEESRHRLGTIVDQMDENNDDYIDIDELVAWIQHSFLTLDKEEAHNTLNDTDVNNDGKVTWAEYINYTFGYSLPEIANLSKDTSEDSKAFVKMIHDDEQKFKLADQNKDGIMQEKEYAAFIHPTDYPHMHSYEISKTIEDLDKNKDNHIDITEYIGDSKGDKEKELADQENFKQYDKNSDGKLDASEIKDWVIPDNTVAAQEEAQHLLLETDEDKDERLTKDEIVDHYELWVGSSVAVGTKLEDQDEHEHHDPEEL